MKGFDEERGKRMKRLFALGLALLLCGCALAEEPELTEAQSALLEYAMQKQSQYIELILSDVMDSLWDTVEDEKETRALFEQIRPAAPKAAILLTTKAELTLESPEVKQDLPVEMLPNICFNRMYYTTQSSGCWSLARMSAITAQLDTADIPEMPAISYVIFAYDVDLPEVVAAFVSMPSGGAIAYTTFVYIPGERRMNGGGFFATDVVCHWEEEIFDSVILNPLPEPGK